LIGLSDNDEQSAADTGDGATTAASGLADANGASATFAKEVVC
jgi:hypothetical protein